MDNQLSVVIVEDEKSIQEMLVGKLLADPAFALVGRAASKEEALSQVAEKKPDLVLLDLRLYNDPEAGFTIAGKLATWPNPPSVIFVTANEIDGARAFDYPNAVHYLTKSIDWPKFYAALDRVKALARKSLLFSDINRLLTALDDVLDIHLADGTLIGNVHKTLKVLEQELGALGADAPMFFRAHVSFIANLSQVQELRSIPVSQKDEKKKDHKHRLVFRGSGKTVPVARGKLSELKERLGLSKKR